MGYSVNLKVYEGPMDLLLDLIKKNEIDIYDIPIALITSEFLAYIKAANEINLELTSDFIVMASTLLEIKSKTLLPKLKLEDEEDKEEDDPRDELVRKILEYEKFKEVSEELRKSAEYEKKAFYKYQEDFSYIDEASFLKNLNVEKLFKTFSNIISRSKSREIKSEIIMEQFTISMAINRLKEKIKINNKFYFSELFDEYAFREEIISYFLATLEMIRMGELLVKQNEEFTDILIIRRNDD